MEKEEFKFPDEQENKETEVKEEGQVAASGDLEVEVVDDTPPEDRGRKPLAKNPEPSEDELEQYSETVKKRINELRHGYHDERRAKEEALREREEALRLAQQILEENNQLKQRVTKNETTLASTFKQAADAELDKAKRIYKDALESGDAEKITEAQVELARATNRAERAAMIRPAAPARPAPNPAQQVAGQQFPSPYNQVQPAQQPVNRPDPKAVEWTRNNPWFGKDEEMTAFAMGLHAKLVKSGVDPQSDEYYERINSRLKQVFPDQFEDKSEVKREPARKPATVVAPATRSNAPQRVTLTKSQEAIAKKLNIPVQRYAKEFAKLVKQDAQNG